ncbi:MAG: hypothetical protein V1723_03820, partial [Candidatus Uhrbacteria bacterium]
SEVVRQYVQHPMLDIFMTLDVREVTESGEGIQRFAVTPVMDDGAILGPPGMIRVDFTVPWTDEDRARWRKFAKDIEKRRT